ncbi:IST1-LIKE 7 [Hibiscus trionum]|uniref:IST1-LIKE 7 n=1 Tax=Hibiscus trionum TaxID=183268 RepID=A0A9W7J4V1_HIBTR|nr:IST1-LIKE 7 [Hibiscus trionum]
MLDGILGRGFASKCKSLIKLIKSRIEVIRRKKTATLKFLKKDVADLLANGLDINAYGRVEGYIAELVLSSCYDFVEKCCDFVSKHVSLLQKLRDCPEDCREAVSSLMFAAARFSDLPELRDLRQIFHERYGNSLELFVNKQLVENSASNSFTMEKKVKVMHDVASEFSIKWDSEAFKRRMSKPAMIPQDQPKTHGSFPVSGYNHKSNDGRNADPREENFKVSSKEKLEVGVAAHRFGNSKEGNASKRDEIVLPTKQEFVVDGYHLHHGGEQATARKETRDLPLRQKQEVSASKLDYWNGKDDVALKTARLSSSSHGKRMERADDGAKLEDGRQNGTPRRDNQNALPERKPEQSPSYADPWSKSRDKDQSAADNYGRQYGFPNSTRKTHEEDEPKWKSHFNSSIPPPYVKPSTKPKDRRHDDADAGSSLTASDCNGVSADRSTHDRAYAVNRTDKYREGLYQPDKEGQIIPPPNVNNHDGDGEKDYYYNHDGSDAPIPRRKSSRRRHKSSSGHTEVDNAEDVESARSRRPRSRRKEDSRRGLQILFDDEQHKNDEEERIIDKLLIHYSKKPPSGAEGMVRRKSKSRHAHHSGSDARDCEAPRKASRARTDDDMSESVSRPVRSVSLPPEQTAEPEGTKVYARAASFQPDRSNAAQHVHPKLPDYDDLAAHFAAMKGR